MFGLDIPMIAVMIFILGLFLLPAIVGAWVASIKKRSKAAWFVLCFLLPLLLIVVAVLPPKVHESTI